MTRTRRLFTALAVGALVATSGTQFASAAWPTNSTTPFLIANTSGDNGLPQVVALPDGGCYVLWRSWDVPAGYSTRLQRLDAAGNEMWAHNGVVVAVGDHTSTIVGGADLAVASDGAALVSMDTSSDPANPGVRQCNIQKISAAGVKLWGTGGNNIAVSTGSGWGVPAHICGTSDGGCIIVFNTDVPANVGNDYITMRRFSSTGSSVWASPKYIFEAANNLVVTDVQRADGDNYVVSWIRSNAQSAFLTQKFTETGVASAGWPTPITLDASGLTNRDFPTFQSDGNGGAIYAWRSYANNQFGSPSEAKLQHILSNGTVKFPVGGLDCFDASFSPGDGRQTASLSFTYDSGASAYTYFVASTQGPVSNGVAKTSVVQKIDNGGNRMWTGAGLTAMPESFNQQVGPGNTTCVATGDGGCIVLGTVGRGLNTINSVVYAVKGMDGGGGFPNAVWSTVIDSDAASAKGRMSAVKQATSNDVILAYGRGGGLGGVIAAAKVANADGAPGVVPVPPSIDVDLPFSVAACDGDTIQLSIEVSGTPNMTYVWQRHYAADVANPDAFWGLTDGNSAFGCIIPDDGTTYSGTNTATLTINNVHALPPSIVTDTCSVTPNPANNLYRCIVFNAADTVVYSSQVFIDVTQCASCPGDFNNSGSVTADDIFAFLDAWFAQNGQSGSGLTADVNASGSVTADDIFAFLDTWFANNGSTCP